MNLIELREQYHQRLCEEIIRVQPDEPDYLNFADKGNKASREIAWIISRKIGYTNQGNTLKGQTTGGRFETITRDYLQQCFRLLAHLRPGKWQYKIGEAISDFFQYEHLAKLEQLISKSDELTSALGKEYIITPDIIVSRLPVSDDEINTQNAVIKSHQIAQLTPLREVNYPELHQLLHASISCKWTLRSDRGQNARTEALNLIRHRKGHLPHVVAVTAEPLPTRIASLALGTGDLDCVYHFALPELCDAVSEISNEDQKDMLETLIAGRRLRDISDLPFDLIT
jgi:hypothetical protein